MLRTLIIAGSLCTSISFSATFGTATGPTGGATYSDIVLDEARTQLYLVNSANNKIDIYNYKSKAFSTFVTVNSQPAAAALSWPVNGSSQYLYVVAYGSSSLVQINLTAKNGPAISATISIPNKPEAVAVGADGRVLVTSAGSGSANTQTLFIYDPNTTTGAKLSGISIAVPPPTAPVTPSVPGREFLAYRAALIATPDGKYMIGANGISSSTRLVFVYETASGTVLASREVSNISDVLAVSPDGSRFMSGSAMFATNTLQVLAQQNVSNSPYAFPQNTSFTTQSNQGGGVFSPDGTTLYMAYNVNPVQSPAAKANISQLLLNDPTNLLIHMGIQLPENLAGKMVIDKAGDTIYALSDSGFITLPVSTISSYPLIGVDSTLVSVANDQCGVTAKLASSVKNVVNSGKGRITVTAQAYTPPAQSTATVGGTTLTGGVGGIGIVLPGGGAGGGGFTPPGGGPGTPPGGAGAGN
jgi:hypothetical protein